MFSILITLWIKLSLILVEQAQRLWYFLLDGRQLNRPCEGWVELPSILISSQARRVLYMSRREGSETPIIFTAPLIMHCRFFFYCWHCSFQTTQCCSWSRYFQWCYDRRRTLLACLVPCHDSTPTCLTCKAICPC